MATSTVKTPTFETMRFEPKGPSATSFSTGPSSSQIGGE